jgi:hypothetical protein
MNIFTKNIKLLFTKLSIDIKFIFNRFSIHVPAARASLIVTQNIVY